MDKFIVGFGCNTNEYTVNGVKYIVESKFVPANFKDMKSNLTIENRVGKYLKSDFAELPIVESGGKITVEDVCSAAGKEDNNAVEKIKKKIRGLRRYTVVFPVMTVRRVKAIQ